MSESREGTKQRTRHGDGGPVSRGGGCPTSRGGSGALPPWQCARQSGGARRGVMPAGATIMEQHLAARTRPTAFHPPRRTQDGWGGGRGGGASRRPPAWRGEGRHAVSTDASAARRQTLPPRLLPRGRGCLPATRGGTSPRPCRPAAARSAHTGGVGLGVDAPRLGQGRSARPPRPRRAARAA